MIFRTFLGLLFGVMLLSCGGHVGVDGSGGGAPDGGSSGSGSSGSGAGDVQCTGAQPKFPTFDKTCAGGPDCVTKLHQINCCGTRVAIGVAAGSSAAFDAAEKTCEAMYPGCGCAQGPTMAEDGKTGPDASIQVACTMGKCMTFVP